MWKNCPLRRSLGCSHCPLGAAPLRTVWASLGLSLGDTFSTLPWGFVTVAFRLWVYSQAVSPGYSLGKGWALKTTTVPRDSLKPPWDFLRQALSCVLFGFWIPKSDKQWKRLGFVWRKKSPLQVPRVFTLSFGVAPLRIVWLPLEPDNPAAFSFFLNPSLVDCI